jgi:hypothetical protein
MKYINSEVFGITFSFFFAIPTAQDVFLEYVAPVLLENNSNQLISFIIFIIQILIFIIPLAILCNLVKKYYNMRGIRTANHERNIIISLSLGTLLGLMIQRIVF